MIARDGAPDGGSLQSRPIPIHKKRKQTTRWRAKKTGAAASRSLCVVAARLLERRLHPANGFCGHSGSWCNGMSGTNLCAFQYVALAGLSRALGGGGGGIPMKQGAWLLAALPLLWSVARPADEARALVRVRPALAANDVVWCGGQVSWTIPNSPHNVKIIRRFSFWMNMHAHASFRLR